MADIDLPVFSFRMNWLESPVERLSFLTDVLNGPERHEQRRQLRATPRRSLDADFLLSGRERSFFDLFSNRIFGQEMLIPLYWDVATLTAATSAGVTDRLSFDTRDREFEVGGLAIIQGSTAFEFEVVEIVGMDDDGLDLYDPVSTTWPRRTKIMPIRRGVIDDMGGMQYPSAAVALVNLRPLWTVANTWTPAADASTIYEDLPVFATEPNWVEGLDVTHERQIDRLDNKTSSLFQVDPIDRALMGQQHRWFLNGRSQLAGFRDLLYRHAGRAGQFWLPTFRRDLVLVNSPGSAATSFNIEKIGYEYTGGPVEGRQHVAIKHAGGTIYREVEDVGPGPTSDTETVQISASLGLDLSPGLVRRISFMDVARFDQDDFEIVHHGGPDGLHEVNAVFRNIRNLRDPSGEIHYPIPVTDMNELPCDNCAGCPESEWFLKVTIETAPIGYELPSFILRPSANGGIFPYGGFIREADGNHHIITHIPGGEFGGTEYDNPDPTGECPSLPMLTVQRVLGTTTFTYHYPITRPYYHDLSMTWPLEGLETAEEREGNLGIGAATMTVEYNGEDPEIVLTKSIREVFQNYFRLDI